jgi:hypothetical protein
LDEIFNYVKEGGIFLNISDIPGYWAYNKLLERRLDDERQLKLPPDDN